MRRNKCGTLLMILGAALLIGALSLFLYNQQEDIQAEQSSVELMTQLMEKIETSTVPPEYVGIPEELLDPSAFEMTEVEINGYHYIGYLSIPSLELELPIMSDWSYLQLQIAPCRYYGSLMGKDLVLMAHNYRSHFGRISELKEGDSVIFVDMNGATTQYHVMASEVLPPTAVDEITAGVFDLTLFTCNYSGQSRVTVYCDMVE